MCYLFTFYGRPSSMKSCINASFIVILSSGDHLIIFSMKSRKDADALDGFILFDNGNFGASEENSNYSALSHLSKKCFGGFPNVYWSI